MAPIKPDGYDKLPWREPEPDISRRKKKNEQSHTQSGSHDHIESKIEGWACKPNLNVHKIIGIVKANEGIKRDALINELKSRMFSNNSYGAIASLMTNAGNSYGKVLEEKTDGDIYFTARARKIIEQFSWDI